MFQVWGKECTCWWAAKHGDRDVIGCVLTSPSSNQRMFVMADKSCKALRSSTAMFVTHRVSLMNSSLDGKLISYQMTGSK